ncbi:MAG TPA: hypothetical protein VJX67_03225 [Blastocatellia bacterium]|nr:hypothetical protein [Blastocatellia bacterium]
MSNGHFHVGTDTGPNGLFYFLCNPDGTLTLACKGWKANPWYVYRDWKGLYYVGEYKNASGTPHDWAKFHLLPGQGKTYWIFDNSTGTDGKRVNEVVGVDPQGYLVRSNPYDTGAQLFRLDEKDTISAQDQAEIKKIWPHYGDYAWWGKEN